MLYGLSSAENDGSRIRRWFYPVILSGFHSPPMRIIKCPLRYFAAKVGQRFDFSKKSANYLRELPCTYILCAPLPLVWMPLSGSAAKAQNSLRAVVSGRPISARYSSTRMKGCEVAMYSLNFLMQECLFYDCGCTSNIVR